MADEREVKVGTSVRFRFGFEEVTGHVAEDRGPIGVQSRHLYRIIYQTESQLKSSIELPAKFFEVVDERPPARRRSRKIGRVLKVKPRRRAKKIAAPKPS